MNKVPHKVSTTIFWFLAIVGRLSKALDDVLNTHNFFFLKLSRHGILIRNEIVVIFFNKRLVMAWEVSWTQQTTRCFRKIPRSSVFVWKCISSDLNAFGPSKWRGLFWTSGQYHVVCTRGNFVYIGWRSMAVCCFCFDTRNSWHMKLHLTFSAT